MPHAGTCQIHALPPATIGVLLVEECVQVFWIMRLVLRLPKVPATASIEQKSIVHWSVTLSAAMCACPFPNDFVKEVLRPKDAVEE